MKLRVNKKTGNIILSVEQMLEFDREWGIDFDSGEKLRYSQGGYIMLDGEYVTIEVDRQCFREEQ